MSHPAMNDQMHDRPRDASAATAPPAFCGPVVEVDVRDDLRSGREPFSRIMAATRALGDGEVLHLRATFEPVPLFRVMERQGFLHVARHNGPEDWSVWFHRPEDAPLEGASGATVPVATDGDGPTAAARPVTPGDVPAHEREIVLDVRGLEPPQPMVRTLEALETLPAGATLVQRNERVPQFLLPILGERGFEYEVDTSSPDAVVVRIRRAG